jgi:hypothetical protein
MVQGNRLQLSGPKYFGKIFGFDHAISPRSM